MPVAEAKPFYFKKFTVHQDRCAMKIGTDGVLLGAWADTTAVRSALDVGTGTGVIAIMLAQRSREARIKAVEIDREAYEQARQNMALSPWAQRLEAVHGAVQEFARTSRERFDLIVSNPPFFSGGTFSNNHDRNQVRHTIKMPHGDLLAAVRTLLAPEGTFGLILPLIEGLRFVELAESYHLYCIRQTEVKPKASKPVERLLLQFSRQPADMIRDRLIIQEESGEWTKEYRQLTGDFYLKA